MISVDEPLLDGNEKKYLAEGIDTGWMSSEGPFVRQFEECFAARVGRRYGIAVGNGSAALETAVAAPARLESWGERVRAAKTLEEVFVDES